MLKKYLMFLLFLTLSIAYIVFIDVLVGQPWSNFGQNLNYAMISPTQKITIAALFITLVVPDLVRLLKRPNKKPNAKADSGS
ncbi:MULTISPECIES: hypothetical protein [Paenibacillus]|uniref:hypothetical protein n=1 Tax=Paenibacillus TaxID=44249 RepID=UPI002FE1E864